MSEKKHLIVIGGATATGKTAAAIHLARHFGTEILSADSRQFYREMSIGTAKQTTGELAAAPHHFVNSLSVEDEYAVGDFEREAIALLRDLFQKKDVVVMAGGSGLFLRAVCEGLDAFPEVPPNISEQLQEQWQSEGLDFLQNEIRRLDPEYAEKVDLNNPMRLLRALGVCRASGRPYSSFRKGKKVERDFTPHYILLDMEREKLYERINLRVDKMMENGLLAEAENLFPFRHLNSLQTVGYQELFEFLSGKTSLPEAVELIKRNSRRYAKRQMTWFRKGGHWQPFSPEDFAGMTTFLKQKMRIEK